MPSSKGAVSRPRRTTPQSPQKAQSAPEVPRQTRRNTRSASHDIDPRSRPQAGLALNAVIEEPISDAFNLPEPSVGFSEVSDLSAETQSELQSLEPELIIEALPSLYADASKVLNLFDGLSEDELVEVSEVAQDAAAPKSKRLRYHITRLVASLHAFGTVRIFINPDLVLRKLRADHDVNEHGSWRPDAVLYMANTALFLATIVVGTEEQLDELLQRTFPFFPLLFVPADAGSRFSTTLKEQSVELANNLRTQMFIRHTRAAMLEPNFDPDDALKDIFYNGAELKGLECFGTETPIYAQQIEEHLRELRTFFSHGVDAPVRLEDLEARYPWSSFMYQASQWAASRRQELEGPLTLQGGVSDLVDRLLAEDFVSAHPEAPANYTQPLPRATAPEQAGRSLQGNLARKKQLDANRARQGGDDFVSQAPQSIQGEVPETLVQESGGDLSMADEELMSVLSGVLDGERAQAQQQQSLAFLARSANQMNVERQQLPRFLDRQEDAQRLRFDDTTQSSVRNGKRPAVAGSEDGDFQTDPRPQNKRVRLEDHNIDPLLRGDVPAELGPEDMATTQVSLPPSAQPRGRGGRNRTTGVAAPRPTSTAPVPTPQSPKASPSPSGPSTGLRTIQSQVDDEAAPGPSQLLRRAQEKAKARTREHKTMAPTQLTPGSPDPTQNTLAPASQRVLHQQRQAWTVAEEDRLMSLIAADGPSYSKILKADANHEIPRLQDRGQVQLKDKARNIKFSFLKAGEDVPQGFGAVSIGKKMVEKLRQLGIPVEVFISVRHGSTD